VFQKASVSHSWKPFHYEAALGGLAKLSLFLKFDLSMLVFLLAVRSACMTARKQPRVIDDRLWELIARCSILSRRLKDRVSGRKSTIVPPWGILFALHTGRRWRTALGPSLLLTFRPSLTGPSRPPGVVCARGRRPKCRKISTELCSRNCPRSGPWTGPGSASTPCLCGPKGAN
jgi:hypothetical protein